MDDLDDLYDKLGDPTYAEEIRLQQRIAELEADNERLREALAKERGYIDEQDQNIVAGIQENIETQAKVERLEDALTAISTALDAYGVDYCRGTAKAALEEKENES